MTAHVPPYSPSLLDWQRTVSSAINPLLSKVANTVDVKADGGATGDGSTDDTAAFNAAHTLAATNNAKVYVPATANGYLVSGTVVAKVSMYGDGEATVIKVGSASVDVIQVGVPNVTISDLNFQQSVTRTGGYYVNFNGASSNQNYNSRVERCTFNNWFNCIGFNSVGNINTVRVRDCFMTTNVAGGIGVNFNLTTQGSDIILRDLFITGTSAAQPASAVRMGQIGDINLDHVSTVYCGTGLNIVPATGATAEAIFVNDCLFDSGNGPGISASPAGTINLLKIENTWSCTNTNGLLLGGTGTVQSVEVSGGYFCNNSTGHGINGTNFLYLGVIGGVFGGNTNGIYIGAGMSNFRIIGAKCGTSGLFPINSGAEINIAAGASSNFVIADCDLTGGGTALSNGATGSSGIVVNNLGVNPGPTQTITVGASPFTYTAGYTPETVFIGGGTVSSIAVSGQNVGLTSGTVHLGPKQSVAVTYTAAPTMVRTIA